MAACTSTTTASTWYEWTNNCETSASTTGVWIHWADEGTATTYTPTYQRAYTPPPETEEQRVAREKRCAEEKAKKEAAEKRAEELLVKHLDHVQRKSYKASKSFYVTSNRGTKYLVKLGSHGNVEEVNKEGKSISRFCINVPYGLPLQDNVLAQKLMLEHDEDQFKRTANATRLVAA